MMHIGQNIKRIREEKSLTQEQVASKAKLRRERISDLERRRSMTTTTIEALAKGLGVEPYEILLPQPKGND